MTGSGSASDEDCLQILTTNIQEGQYGENCKYFDQACQLLRTSCDQDELDKFFAAILLALRQNYEAKNVDSPTGPVDPLTACLAAMRAFQENVTSKGVFMPTPSTIDCLAKTTQFFFTCRESDPSPKPSTVRSTCQKILVSFLDDITRTHLGEKGDTAKERPQLSLTIVQSLFSLNTCIEDSQGSLYFGLMSCVWKGVSRLMVKASHLLEKSENLETDLEVPSLSDQLVRCGLAWTSKFAQQLIQGLAQDESTKVLARCAKVLKFFLVNVSTICGHFLHHCPTEQASGYGALLVGLVGSLVVHDGCLKLNEWTTCQAHAQLSQTIGKEAQEVLVASVAAFDKILHSSRLPIDLKVNMVGQMLSPKDGCGLGGGLSKGTDSGDGGKTATSGALVLLIFVLKQTASLDQEFLSHFFPFFEDLVRTLPDHYTLIFLDKQPNDAKAKDGTNNKHIKSELYALLRTAILTYGSYASKHHTKRYQQHLLHLTGSPHPLLRTLSVEGWQCFFASIGPDRAQQTADALLAIFLHPDCAEPAAQALTLAITSGCAPGSPTVRGAVISKMGLLNPSFSRLYVENSRVVDLVEKLSLTSSWTETEASFLAKVVPTALAAIVADGTKTRGSDIPILCLHLRVLRALLRSDLCLNALTVETRLRILACTLSLAIDIADNPRNESTIGSLSSRLSQDRQILELCCALATRLLSFFNHYLIEESLGVRLPELLTSTLDMLRSTSANEVTVPLIKVFEQLCMVAAKSPSSSDKEMASMFKQAFHALFQHTSWPTLSCTLQAFEGFSLYSPYADQQPLDALVPRPELVPFAYNFVQRNVISGEGRSIASPDVETLIVWEGQQLRKLKADDPRSVLPSSALPESLPTQSGGVSLASTSNSSPAEALSDPEPHAMGTSPPIGIQDVGASRISGPLLPAFSQVSTALDALEKELELTADHRAPKQLAILQHRLLMMRRRLEGH